MQANATDQSIKDNVMDAAVPATPTADSPYEILSSLDDYKMRGYRLAVKTADCTGATPISLFTVTGDVVVALIAVPMVDLTTSDAITAQVGYATDTDFFLGVVGDATALVADNIWSNGAITPEVVIVSEWDEYIYLGGRDIILTTTGTVTAGSIAFYCRWYPLSSDGNVVAA